MIFIPFIMIYVITSTIWFMGVNSYCDNDLICYFDNQTNRRLFRIEIKINAWVPKSFIGYVIRILFRKFVHLTGKVFLFICAPFITFPCYLICKIYRKFKDMHDEWNREVEWAKEHPEKSA